jgi:ABC-type transport system involved in multi-copper enzyme maturation permease subunit
MRGMSVVIRRDLKDLRQTNAFLIIVIIFAVVTVGAAVGVSIALSRWGWLAEEATWDEAKTALELIMGFIVYFLTLFALLCFIWGFTGDPMTKEKANGNIESLLATPLSSRAIWMGKSLAIFLPAFVLAIVSTLVVVLVVNLAAIHPRTGNFVFPAPVLVTGFIGNPLLFLGLTLLVVLLSLLYSPDIGVMVSWPVAMGLMAGIPIGAVVGAIDMASWSFTLYYLAGAIILGAVVFYLSRLLTKERVILSSKGG